MTTIFKEEPVDSIDLSFVADALLAMCENERDAPFYTEDGFETKLQRIRRRETTAADELISGRVDAMLAIECRDVLSAAGLTARQHEVLDLRLEGFTFEEIGGFGRTSKQAAMNVFVQALKKISRTFREYRYAGLSEVYRSEVERPSRGRSFGTMVR
ncbi:hypothetical protein EON82_03690 [bacterium]|nr:MAG: hypothetical protein EON82_03690 [bacterium]